MAYLPPQSSAPLDNYGADGDTVQDYKGRFLWGPKGLVTPGSWAGTANSIVGPTGPIGPLGPAGPTSSAMGVGWSPIALAATAITTSATPVVLNGPDGVTPQVYVAGANNFFVGASLSASIGPVTFELWNQTAGTRLWQSSQVANNASALAGPFANYTYPMIAGHSYVWRVTGTGSFQGYANAEYYQSLPTPAPTGVVSTHPLFQHIGAINSTTASNMGAQGDKTILNYVNPRASTFYNCVVESAASGSGSAIFYLYNLTAGSTVYIVADITGATANVLPGQRIVTPVLNIGLTANSYYQWRVYGSGTGTYTATMNIVQ